MEEISIEEIRVGDMIFRNPLPVNKNGIRQIWHEWEKWKEEEHINQKPEIYYENEITFNGCYIIELMTGERILIQNSEFSTVILT